MKIFVDFDRVAFNVEKLYEELELEGTPEPGTEESLEYLNSLGKGRGVKDLLFEDFVTFAERCKAMGHEIYVVSSPSGFTGEWDLEYQEKKVEMSEIRKHVTAAYVSTEKKGDLIGSMLQKGEKALFIEDKPEHLLEVQQSLLERGLSTEDVELIQMLRKETRQTGKGFESTEAHTGFEQLKDFKQLESLFDKEKEKNDEE